MSNIRKKRIPSGIEIIPNDVPLDREGQISVSEDDKKLKVRLDDETRSVLTEDQTQEVTNKTIDADDNDISNIEVDNLKSGVLNTSNDLVGASNTQIPSALAVKTFVENIESGLDQEINDLTDVVNDLITLSGVAEESTDLGEFTNDLVPDNQTIKDTIEGLASNVESEFSDLSNKYVDFDTEQTVENKILENSIIQETQKLEPRHDIYDNLVSYATTATSGQYVYATDRQKSYQIIDGILKEFGGGSSSSGSGYNFLINPNFENDDTAEGWDIVFGTPSDYLSPMEGDKSLFITSDPIEGSLLEQIVVKNAPELKGQYGLAKIAVKSNVSSVFTVLVDGTPVGSVTIPATSVNSPFNIGIIRFRFGNTSTGISVYSSEDIAVDIAFLGLEEVYNTIMVGVDGQGVVQSNEDLTLKSLSNDGIISKEINGQIISETNIDGDIFYKDVTIDSLNTENGILFTDIDGKLSQLYNFKLSSTGNLEIPNSLIAKNITVGGTSGNLIESTEDINLKGDTVTFETTTRAKSYIGSNNYDVENLAKYPNFLEGSTDQYTCLACTPSIVVGGGVMAGTNSLKITHTTTSQLTFEAPTSGELGQYVTLNISVKTDTITHIVPVTDTVGDVTNEWILSPSNNYQTVTITYPMGATSTGFFVIPQDGGETEISQVHLKRANDKSFLVSNDTKPVPCAFSTLAWQGLGTVTNNMFCSRRGSQLVIVGSFVTGTVSATNALIPLPTNWGNITINVVKSHYGFFVRDAGSQQVLSVARTTSTNQIAITNNIVYGTANPFTGTLGNTVFSNDQRVGIAGELVIEINEWQSSSKVTPVECAFADKRKCTEGNKLYFKYDKAAPLLTAVTDQFGNTYSVAKSGNGNTQKSLNISSLNLTSPMTCVLGPADIGTVPFLLSSSTTLVNFATIETTVGTELDSNVNITCSKNGNDIYYGPNYVASCENTSSLNEVMCGRDETVSPSKPIYKKCFNTLPATGTVLVTGVSKLIGQEGYATGNLGLQFPFPTIFTSDENQVLAYKSSSTNNIVLSKEGTNWTTDGQFCIRYTKL